ncbi:hypothetical protein Tco_0576724 [Tanacetum coccineum]
MNTTQAQQKALDDTLVAPADHLEASIRFTIDKKKVSHDVDIFRDILQFYLKIPRQVFKDLPREQDILSFIRDLGHTGDITYLTDVNVDYLHQPWRAFTTVINKCLSGKETGMDKIHLSRVKFSGIKYKDAKKTNKMSYPRFTKIIIDYFMSKDPSISRRNKMFWHTARDDTLFTSMRCISRHEDTRVYGTILPTELTNQAMLEAKAYQTYYAFASREKALKPKYIQKKVDSDTSPKKKPVQATTKGTRLKSKAKVTKPDKKKQPAKKTKAKGLAVLSKVALTEAEQLKLATKRSKKYIHVSYASGSGDGADTQSKVPDEQQQKNSGIDEGTGPIPGVPNVPPYESKSDKESWGDSEDEDDTNDDGDNDDDGESDDHDDDSDDERTESDRHEIPDPNLTNVDQTELEEEEDVDDIVHTPLDYELTNDEKLDDEETMDDEEDNEVIKELYDDVNVNLGNDDTEMTDADQGALEQQNVSQESGFKQIEEDAHAILTPVIEAQKADEPVQSSSVSSDFTSKLLNLKNPSPADNEIASLMETSACHATAIPKITFDVSLIPGIVYTYLASKMKEAVDVAIQLQTNKLREEAQAKNQEFLNQVDSTIKIIIKDKVKGQVSKIMPKIEKYVTESLGAEVLVRSINQPQTSYVVAASLSEFELKKNLIDKMEANKAINRSDNPKNIYNALVESYNSNKDIITSYGNVVLLKRGRDDQDKDEDPSARSDQGTKRRKSGKDVEFYKDSRSKEKKSSSTSKDAS